MTTHSRTFLLVAAVIVLGVGVSVYLTHHREEPRPPVPTAPPDPEDIAAQVHNFCGGACHAYPPPDTFPRQHWRTEVGRGFDFFEKSGLALKPPPIASVIRYYESRAPEELPHAKITPPTRPLNLRFEKLTYPGPDISESFAISHVNLVRLPPPGKSATTGPFDILACEMRAGLVMLLRPSEPAPAWKIVGRVSNPAHAEVLDLDGDGLLDILVANLGSFGPTDLHCGGVVWLRGRADGTFTPVVLLKDVGRVADVQAADFRGTGKLDLVVGVFGWQTAGELLLLENHTSDWDHPQFVKRVVDPRHGTIHVPVADLNDDGKPDFVALISQEHETVTAYLNDGRGKFTARELYRAPHPGYGSSGIQLVDLNGDGKLDVLYSNGDTLDDPFLFKPYHGVQWLENQGQLRFAHRSIAPMYGVHQARAAGVLGSGRLDVVAAGFLPADKFPERGARRADALLLLEQSAPGQFERHALATVDCDHVTCAVGDLFGSGRLDIVAGNFSAATTRAPVTIWRNLGAK